MLEAVLVGVSDAAEVLRSWIADDNDFLGEVCGEQGAGKSYLLQRVASELAQPNSGLWPIVVSPPRRSLDAGPIALGQLATGLKQAGGLNGSIDGIMLAHAPWSKKLGEIAAILEQNSEKLVLFVDEPVTWKQRLSEDHQYFDGRVDEVVSLLRDRIRCRRIFTAGRSDASGLFRSTWNLQTRVDSERLLTDASYWEDLAPYASAVWNHLGTTLDSYSILSIQLLVALSAIISVEAAAQLPRWPHQLAKILSDALQQRNDLDSLCDLWAQLALLRTPFERSLFGHTGSPAAGTLGDLILRKCLLTEIGDALLLSDVLRIHFRRHSTNNEAQQDWLTGVNRENCHLRFARYYRQRFHATGAATLPLQATLRDEMEAFYHATMSHDPTCMDDFRVFFPEQLNILGKHLSLDARDYHSASIVFVRSLQWDPDDNYAHHYLAWNLDVQGKSPEKVRDHYSAAIRIAPDRVWWWSRWICFLITLGQNVEAEQQWIEAQDALELPDPDRDVSIYFDLHSWVARLLLHRGQLAFAKRVLDAIPEKVTMQHDAQILSSMKQHLNVFLEVQRNRAVFPPFIDRNILWRGPHINSQRNHANRQLTAWIPARVESIEPDAVFLLAACPPDGQSLEPEYGEMELERSQFDRWCYDLTMHELQIGQFVEIGFYGKDKDDAVIRVYRESPVSHLPPVYPDPVRFLRHAGWVRQ